MMAWLLLLMLSFCMSTQDGHGQDTGVLQCGPQKMTLNTSTSNDQTILLTWEDDPSCSAVHDLLIYELVVLIAEKQVHYDEVAVTPDQIGSTHSWNWTSQLALECASHSVRLRSRYKNQTSPWKQEKTSLGEKNNKRPNVYPEGRVFNVGSRTTFCCVLPAGQSFDKMFLPEYSSSDMNATKISNRTYALTVNLDQPSKFSCTDVKCIASIWNEDKKTDNGACAFVGYPPSDKDVQCETRDLESVECHWTVGRMTHLPKNTLYQVLGSSCTDGTQGRCSKKVQVVAGERNWTLTAQNQLGKVELSDWADLTKRVHMFAPEGVTASVVNARNVSLEWGWTVQRYHNLNITCQVNVERKDYSGANAAFEKFGVGLTSAVLTDLIPNWTYNVTMRCGTAQHFWKWGDWSTGFNFHTRGDDNSRNLPLYTEKVPDALDVWMQMPKHNETIIIWKVPLANQSHGNIIDYAVTWAKTTEPEGQNGINVAHDKHHVALSLDATGEYLITVTARNVNGSSSPSAITIPPFAPDTPTVNTSRIIGSNGSFSLSWSASPTASCGYIVDWCPTSGHCSVEWLKVPPHETNTNIFSETFEAGRRYTLSVYACTQGAPVLLERREGYVSETEIKDNLFKNLATKQEGSDVEVSWDPISKIKEQTAFIQGYILYWSDSSNNKVFNVSTGDPGATSLTAKNLKIRTYKFTVKAQTAVGECGTTFIDVTLDSPTDNLIKTLLISLVTVCGFLCLITVLFCRHWACIKQKVYPPIPKPVLTDKWLTSPGEHICHPLPVDQCHHMEVDIMDVPALHYKSGAPVNGYVRPENIPFVFRQTPKGYYNKPLKVSTSPDPVLSTAAIPSHSGSPSSLLSTVFPNLSYNLPGPEEGSSLERNSSGYQPQQQIETPPSAQTEEYSESSIVCISTYILVPQSNS